MDSNGCPVSEAPRNAPATHPAISVNPQRNCPARKNAAIGSIQRYHTPCTNVQMAINGAIHNTVHHLGGDEPRTCQTKRMVSSPAIVTKNGRPIKNRNGTSDVSAAAANVINHASGRFNHGNADQLTNVNNATTANKTNLSVSHLLRR